MRDLQLNVQNFRSLIIFLIKHFAEPLFPDNFLKTIIKKIFDTKPAFSHFTMKKNSRLLKQQKKTITLLSSGI